MEIKEFQEGYKSKILDLFKICFGKELSEEYWDWRFLRNPFISEKYIHLMFNDDELIGHYAISPIEMIIDGDKKKTALSMTTMTHPAYGGKGVFSQLASNLYKKLECDGFDMVWGFPNNNSHYGFNKNLGWKDIAIIPMMKLEVSNIILSRTINCLKIDEIESFIINLLHNDESLIRINKNLSYMLWRYTNNPTANYSVVKTDDDESFLIFKEIKSFNNLEKCEIDIMEFYCPSINHLSSLIAYVIELTKNVNTVNIWKSIGAVNQLTLEKLGFRYYTPLTYLGARSFCNNSSIFNFNNWDLSLGYSDVF